MNKRQAESYARTVGRLMEYGISHDDVEALFRIERTLSRWSEMECNGEIERDENSGKVYAGYPGDRYNAKRDRLFDVADRESGALKRLASIMSKYPTLWSYHQGDPRGCSLYIGKWADLPGGDTLMPIAADRARIVDGYYTRGVAVCI